MTGYAPSAVFDLVIEQQHLALSGRIARPAGLRGFVIKGTGFVLASMTRFWPHRVAFARRAVNRRWKAVDLMSITDIRVARAATRAGSAFVVFYTQGVTRPLATLVTLLTFFARSRTT